MTQDKLLSKNGLVKYVKTIVVYDVVKWYLTLIKKKQSKNWLSFNCFLRFHHCNYRQKKKLKMAITTKPFFALIGFLLFLLNTNFTSGRKSCHSDGECSQALGETAYCVTVEEAVPERKTTFCTCPYRRQYMADPVTAVFRCKRWPCRAEADCQLGWGKSRLEVGQTCVDGFCECKDGYKGYKWSCLTQE